jgi:general secretion pathway protein B
MTTAPKSPPAIQAAPAPQPAVPDVHALPESLRRELPNLTIGGAMYSDTRTNRMLVLNNQVFHEGDQPAPGLVLEEIRLKSAVFNYRGTRYSVNY